MEKDQPTQKEVNVEDLLHEDSGDDVPSSSASHPSSPASKSQSTNTPATPTKTSSSTATSVNATTTTTPHSTSPNVTSTSNASSPQKHTSPQSTAVTPSNVNPVNVGNPDADDVFAEDSALVTSIDTALMFERRLLQSGRRLLNSPLSTLRAPSNQAQRAQSTVLKATNLFRLWSQVSQSLTNPNDMTGAPTCSASHSRLIAIGSSKGLVSLFDPFQKPIALLGKTFSTSELNSHGGVVCLDISANAEYLVSGHTSGHMLLWDLSNFSLLRVVSDFSTNPITELQIIRRSSSNSGKSSPQCQFLAVSRDGFVSIVTCSKGLFFSWTHNLESLLQGKVGPVLSAAALSPSLISPLPHPSDAYHIIAITSEQITLFVALEPAVRILCKINRDPPEVARPGALPSLSWRPPRSSSENALDRTGQSYQQAQAQAGGNIPLSQHRADRTDDLVEREAQQLSHPLLALSRDKIVTLISVMPVTTKVVGTVSESVKTGVSVSTAGTGTGPGTAPPQVSGPDTTKQRSSTSTPAPAGGPASSALAGFAPIKFEKLGSLVLSNEIVAVHWLDGNVLVVLDVAMQLIVIDPVLLVVMETFKLPTPNPLQPASPTNTFIAIGHQLFGNPFTKKPETCYETTVRSSDANILLLGRAQVIEARLLSWFDRVNVLAETDWLAALALALDFFECKARGAIGLPRTLAARQSVLSDQIADLVIQFMDTTLRKVVLLSPTMLSPPGQSDTTANLRRSIPEASEYVDDDDSFPTPDPRGNHGNASDAQTKTARSASRLVLDAQWTPEAVAAVCLDYCSTVRRPDVISSLLFPRFVKAGLQRAFFSVFEPYVMTGRVCRIERNLTAGLARHLLGFAEIASISQNLTSLKHILSKHEIASIGNLVNPAHAFKRFFSRADIALVLTARDRIRDARSSHGPNVTGPSGFANQNAVVDADRTPTKDSFLRLKTGADLYSTSTLAIRIQSLEQIFTRLDPSLGFDDLRYALRLSRSLVLPAALLSLHARCFANYSEGIETLFRSFIMLDKYHDEQKLTMSRKSSTADANGLKPTPKTATSSRAVLRGGDSLEDGNVDSLSASPTSLGREDGLRSPSEDDNDGQDSDDDDDDDSMISVNAINSSSLPAASPSISRSFGRSFAFTNSSRAVIADRKLDSRSWDSMILSMKLMDQSEIHLLRLRSMTFLISSLRGLSFPTFGGLPKKNCTYPLPLPAPSVAKVMVPVPSSGHSVAQILTFLCARKPAKAYIPDDYLHLIIDDTLSQGVSSSGQTRKSSNTGNTSPYFYSVPPVGYIDSPGFSSLNSSVNATFVPGFSGAASTGVVSPYAQAAAALVDEDTDSDIDADTDAGPTPSGMTSNSKPMPMGLDEPFSLGKSQADVDAETESRHIKTASSVSDASVELLEPQFTYPFLRYALKLAPAEMMKTLSDLILFPESSGWVSFSDHELYGSKKGTSSTSVDSHTKSHRTDSTSSTTSGISRGSSVGSGPSSASKPTLLMSETGTSPGNATGNVAGNTTGIAPPSSLSVNLSPVSQVLEDTTQSLSNFFSNLSIPSPFSKDDEFSPDATKTVPLPKGRRLSFSKSSSPAPHPVILPQTTASSPSSPILEKKKPPHTPSHAVAPGSRAVRATYSRHRALKQFIRQCPTPTALLRIIIEVFQLDVMATNSSTPMNATSTTNSSRIGSQPTSYSSIGFVQSPGSSSPSLSALASGQASQTTQNSQRLIAQPWNQTEISSVYALCTQAIARGLVEPEDLQPSFISALAVSLCRDISPPPTTTGQKASAEAIALHKEEQEMSVLSLLQRIPSLADSTGLLEEAEAKGFTRVAITLYKQKGDFERVIQLYLEKIKSIDLRELGKKSICATPVDTFRAKNTSEDQSTSTSTPTSASAPATPSSSTSSGSFSLSITDLPSLSAAAQKVAAEMFDYVIHSALLTDIQSIQLLQEKEKSEKEKERKGGVSTSVSSLVAAPSRKPTKAVLMVAGPNSLSSLPGANSLAPSSTATGTATAGSNAVHQCNIPFAASSNLTNFVARARVETLFRFLPILMQISPVATVHMCLVKLSHIHDAILTCLEKYPPLLFRYLSLIVKAHEAGGSFSLPSSIASPGGPSATSNEIYSGVAGTTSHGALLQGAFNTLETINNVPSMVKSLSLLTPQEAVLFDATTLPALLDQSFTKFSSKLNEEYIRLLCAHSPERVYLHIVAHHDYEIDSVLSLCRQYKILDACAYLLERTGDVKAALELTLAMTNESLNALLKYVEKNSEHYLISLRYFEDIQNPDKKKDASNNMISSAAVSLLDDKDKDFSVLKANPPKTKDLKTKATKTSQATVTRDTPSLLALLPQKELKAVEHAITVSVALCQRTLDAERLWFAVLDAILTYQRSLRVATMEALDTTANSTSQSKSAALKASRNDSLIKNHSSFSAVDMSQIGAYASQISKLKESAKSHSEAHLLSVETVQRLMDACLFASTRRVLEAMSGHVALSTILMKIIRDHENDSLGEFRETILTLLGTCEHELSSLKSLNDLLHTDKKSLIRKKYRAQCTGTIPRSNFCCSLSCQLPLSISSSSTGAGSGNEIGNGDLTLFSCGHAFHRTCFERDNFADPNFIPGDITTAQCSICIQMVSKANRVKTKPQQATLQSSGSSGSGKLLAPPSTSMSNSVDNHNVDRKQEIFYSLSKLKESSSGMSWNQFSRSVNGL